MTIDLYYWPTPNGWKVSMALEEMGLAYDTKLVDIFKGDQFKPEFLAISPNNRMPAIVDHAPDIEGGPVSVFESGAILTYLADKSGMFLPNAEEAPRERLRVLEWLFWQMGGLGPMMGQLSHFTNYADQLTDDDLGYPKGRYLSEARRLLGIMDTQLEKHEFLAGDYSIADMASYPWVYLFPILGHSLEPFVHVRRWVDLMAARPAVHTGMGLYRELRQVRPKLDENATSGLFKKH